MGARSREFVLLLAACTLALSEPLDSKTDTKKETKDIDNYLFQYDDFDAADDQEVLYNENRPCPRDCICTVSQGYRTAKCDRLEIGTQKFGDDITDLVIENADPRYPIQLTDFIFKKLGLHQVTTVKIVNSTIDFVGPNAFHGLPNLYAVNLSNAKLKSLHPETFAHNKKLLLLTLSNNPLKFPAAGSQEYFLNTSSVQELDISYCNMQYITDKTFKNMPGLMYLNLAGNDLSDMDPDTFRKLLDLEELDLSDNNIKSTSLPDDIFSDNNELATLHISRNPIDTVYGLQISDLLTLNAGQTNIRFVGPSMFNGMTYIANLNLSGNSIKKIHNQAFHKLVELNYLDLSYNDLDFMSNILIKENIELDIFKISNNPRLKHLPAEGFSCSVDTFNIYLFDASRCGLQEIPDDALKTFSALSVINLADNEITSISSKVFSVCPKLVEINLANNFLTTLDPKIFEKNNELGKLNLQGNPLRVFSAEVFVPTPMITWLDMSHAELTSLWSADKNRSATLLGNLTFLNVSYNHITEIKQSELDHLNKLNTLDITNNPLACSRDFETLMTWLSQRKVSPNASASIANMAKDTKEDDLGTYSWEFLARKTCGDALPVTHRVEPLPVVSEEIWERIDKDLDGNFDLKNTLEDAKIPDDEKISDDNDLEDDMIDDDKDDDQDSVEDDDDEGDDAGEEYDDDDDVNIKVNLIEKPINSAKPTSTMKPLDELPTPTEMPSTPESIPLKHRVIDIKTIFPEYDEVVSSKSEEEHGRYDYLWPICIAVLGAILLLLVIAKVVMMMCNTRTKQMRYNSAIIAAMSQPGRTKKDCGLVYQQLSEDLTGPATPKLNRYQPLQTVTVNASNLSYESSPFHHSHIVPEAV